MRIKTNKEPGVILTLTEEEARELMILAFNSRLLIPARNRFKQDLINLLRREGIET